MNEFTGIDPRLRQIILMCQKAKHKYGFYYEERYSKKIKKFSQEISSKNLIEKSSSQHFAKQLCIMNDLEYCNQNNNP